MQDRSGDWEKEDPPEVAAGGGLRGQSRVDLQHVGASVVVIGASWPNSSRSSTCARCHGGSAISDTHDWPGGVASACRTQSFLFTSQHLKKKSNDDVEELLFL